MPVVFTSGSVQPFLSKPLTRGRERVIVAEGVANILLLAPFYILFTSCSMEQVHVPRTTIIAHPTNFSALRKQPSEAFNRETKIVKLLRSINHRNAKQHRCGTMKTLREMTMKDRNSTTSVTKVKFPTRTSRLNTISHSCFSTFASTRDGYLGCISAATHRDSILSAVGEPIRSLTY